MNRNKRLLDYPTEIIEKCEGFEEVLNVINGSHLWKVRSSSNWMRRKFDLNLRDMIISYSPSTKHGLCNFGGSLPRIEVADIVEVRRGWKTDIFNRLEAKLRKDGGVKRKPVEESCCFSIIYGERKDKTMDLIANNPEVADNWVRAIEYLLYWYESKIKTEMYELWLRRKFTAADVDNNKSLTFQETLKLLSDLNIEMNEREAKQLFKQANTKMSRKKGIPESLDEDEFLVLYFQLLKRPELEELFKSYALPNGVMTAKELEKFFKEGQNENLSQEECNLLIQVYEHSDLKHRSELSSAGFWNLLLSQDFDAFNGKKHKLVWQSMDQPLSHYFIASSHNTYVSRNQLLGKSSVESFIEALKRGCKCVEIDCWDGDNGEPVVWHGHTLLSKIPFGQVLEDAIKPYAFIVSEFPLILSLEVHCSTLGRNKMASHLREILGDMLYTEDIPEGMTELPSPKELMGKILLKGKKHYKKSNSSKKSKTVTSKSEFTNVSETDSSVDHHQRRRVVTEASSTIVTSIRVQSTTTASQSQEAYSEESDDEESSEDEADGPKVDEAVTSRSINEVPLEPLCQLVNLIQAVKFKSFEDSRDFGKCYQMSSFGESRAQTFAKEKSSEFINYNKRQISRIYPAGTRAFSTNFHPLQFWEVGCQIVALNYQTPDVPNLVNRAFFKQNGGCGYILKPEYLRKKELTPCPLYIKIRVISGQHLPKIEGESDIVDPYVELKIHGAFQDSTKKLTTKKIQNNGFNPVWDETFEFRVKCPELSFIGFRVRDYAQSGADLPIAYYILPCSAIAAGYRHIQLLGINGESLAPASLFVHISTSELQ